MYTTVTSPPYFDIFWTILIVEARMELVIHDSCLFILAKLGTCGYLKILFIEK